MKWISVKDRLPEPGERVLVFEKDGVFGGWEIDITCRTIEYYPDAEEENNRIVWDGQGIINEIHFWMPLPKPPDDLEERIIRKT